MLTPATIMISELIRLSSPRVSFLCTRVANRTSSDVATENTESTEEKDPLDLRVYFITPTDWWRSSGGKFTLIDHVTRPFVKHLIAGQHASGASVISIVTKDGTVDFSRAARSAMIDFHPENSNHPSHRFFFTVALDSTLTDDAIIKGVRAIYDSSFDIAHPFHMLKEAAGDITIGEFKWPEDDVENDDEIVEPTDTDDAYRYLGYLTYTRNGTDVHYGFGLGNYQVLDIASRLPEIATALAKHLNSDKKTEAVYCDKNYVTTSVIENSIMISIDLDASVASSLGIDPATPVILACIDAGTGISLPVEFMAAHAHAYLADSDVFDTNGKSMAYGVFLNVVKSVIDALVDAP